MSAAHVLVALTGNPNSGKTTAFNAYTGARARVGNFPGVTVERKQGVVELDGERVFVVDLPGTYSLTAYSQEELVTRSVLAEEKPLAVVDIVDASALERNLLLTVQILEMGMPLVLACNMMDEARKAGIHINTGELGKRLGVPVVETVARSGEGLRDALRRAVAFGREKERNPAAPLRMSYGADLDPAIDDMVGLITETSALSEHYLPRWIAVKLLEGDTEIQAAVHRADATLAAKLDQRVSAVAAHLQKTLNTTPEAVIADYRYGFIKSLLRDGVLEVRDANARLALSDKLDRVLTNALVGPLIMLAVLYAIFQATFVLGAYPQGWVEDGFGWLGDVCASLIPEGLTQSLIVDGIIAGVGGVMGFVPLILIIFLFISFLEDSGYMARVAYMLDRVFRLFGLHGNSVMPYIVSGGIAGGCAIPGVLATRTLRSPKEKLATLLTLPYMACGAKLPVFLLLLGVFFPGTEAWTMFCLTLAGWAAALLVGLALRSTVIRGESTPFVMELPPYRLPTLRSIIIHTWERTWQYIKKAGTIIVAVTIILWAGMTFPELPEDRIAPFESTKAQIQERIDALAPDQVSMKTELEDEIAVVDAELGGEALRYSYAGRLGTMLEPYTRPAGFDWRTDIALLGGIAAKEAIVSTLGTAYALGDQDPEEATSLAELLARDPNWSKAGALAVMLFVLLYSPCFVALAVIHQETASWGWTAFSLIFNTALAYGVAVCAYQIGRTVWG